MARTPTWLGALLVLLLGAGLGPAAVSAGVIDSPVPLMEGNGNVHPLFIVPGVIHGVSGGGDEAETVFQCTALMPFDGLLAVEVFDANGVLLNDISVFSSTNGAVSVHNGETVTISTGPLATITPTENINVGTFAGSARILTSTTKFMCTAFRMNDAPFDDPDDAEALPILRGKSQKGD